MNSSLVYTANQRVERYRKSVEFITEDVLLYKGFLGRSLKERNNLPSVGARAARAAGVVVDSLGKLRCPPGTPNANQFTDLQMSNCMVPGLGAARRLAAQASQSTQNMLREAGNMLRSPTTKKRAKGVAKVAALASLVTLDNLDYLDVDGSGSMTASTLAFAEVLRHGSGQLMQATLDRLQRKGKITANQRKNLDKIIEKLAETERYAGVAELLTARGQEALRRRRRIKPTRRDNRVPDVDLTLNDLGQPKEDLDALIDAVTPKLKSSRRTVASGTTAGLAPEFSTARSNTDLTGVTVDADSFNAELAKKKGRLVSKYVPDKADHPVAEYADELMSKMGVATGKPFKEQIDDGIAFLKTEGKEKALNNLTPDKDLSPEAREYLRIKNQAILDAINLLETPEGEKQVRDAMEQGYLEVLVGAEIAMEGNPSLRGKTIMGMHLAGSRGDLKNFSGYAQTDLQSDGRIKMVCTLVSDALIFDQTQLVSDGPLEKGQGLARVVRFAGADDHQVGLAIHEYAHLEHFTSMYETLGIRAGDDAPPLIEQMKQSGKLGDSIIGMSFARSYNMSPSASWEDFEEVFKIAQSKDWNDRQIARQHNLSIAEGRDINEYIFKSATSFANSSVTDFSEENEIDKFKRVMNLGLDFSSSPYRSVSEMAYLLKGLDEYDRAIARGEADVAFNPPPGHLMIDNATGKNLSAEEIREALKNALDGQTVEEFLKSHKEVMDEIFGIDSDYLSSNGVPNSRIMDTLAKSSEYGGTNIFEAVAESRTLSTFIDRFPDMSAKTPSEIQAMKDMLGEIIPPRSAGVARTTVSPRAREHFDRLDRMLSKVPRLKLDENLLI